MLAGNPTHSVSISCEPDVVWQVTTSIATPINLTFDIFTPNTPQSIMFTAVDDALVETDPHTVTYACSTKSLDPIFDGLKIDFSVHITDNDVTPVCGNAIIQTDEQCDD